MCLHRLQMFPDLALNPMERSGTMIFEFYAPNYLYKVFLRLLACFLRIRQKWQQSGKKKQGVTYIGSAFGEPKNFVLILPTGPVGPVGRGC